MLLSEEGVASPSAVEGLPPARRRVAREHVGFHEVRGFHRVSLRLFSPFSTDCGGNDGSSADYTTGVRAESHGGTDRCRNKCWRSLFY